MTFRTRLTLAYLVLLTTALSGFGIWVYAYVDRNLHQEFYVSVQRQSVQLAQVLAGDYDAAANRARETLDRLTTGQEGDTYIVVETRSGKELELEIETKHPLDALSGVDLPVVPPGQVVEVPASANDLGLPLAVYAEPFEASKAIPRAGPAADDQPKQSLELQGQVTVARSLAGVERSLRLLRTILIAGGLAVLLVAALIGLGLAAALLRPLARMRTTAQRIGDQALTTANGLGYLAGALASAAVAQQVTAAVTPSQAVAQSAEVRSHELARRVGPLTVVEPREAALTRGLRWRGARV